MIRGLVLALAMAACAEGAEVDPQLAGPFVLHAGEQEPEAQTEHEPCGMAFDPDPELREATERAAARWSAATGCDVRVEAGGVPVHVASANERGGHRAAAVRAPEGSWSIGVERSLLPWTAETLLSHELGHVLGCLDHQETALMASPTTLRAPIDEAALTCVCAALACSAFSPEVR